MQVVDSITGAGFIKLRLIGRCSVIMPAMAGGSLSSVSA
jgi:hypothetical protein